MKLAAIMLVAVGVASTAHAQLLTPKGAKAVLEVRYEYASAGSYESSSKDQTSHWNVRRVVTLTAQYAADAPQPFGVMHSQDPGQQATMRDLQAQSAAAQKKMAPTMADMMKIAEDCKDDEACITRRVTEYAGTMQVTPDMKSASADVAAMNKAVGSPRFQLWRLVSQSGSYSIEEEHQKQVFEMTCNRTTRLCKRQETRKGGGDIPPPPGGKSVAGSSMLEVDSLKKDAVVTLPVPLAPLSYTQAVTTTIPGEKGGTTQAVAPPWMLKAAKPMTVAIPGELRSVSGTQKIKVDGPQAEGGTLTVTWRFDRP